VAPILLIFLRIKLTRVYACHFFSNCCCVLCIFVYVYVTVVDRFDDRAMDVDRQVLAGATQRDQHSPRQPGLGGGVTPGGPTGLHYPALSCRLPLMSQPGAVRRPTTMSRGSDDRDDAYRERRRKNNEAAKRSRDTRRFKEMQVRLAVSINSSSLVFLIMLLMFTLLTYLRRTWTHCGGVGTLSLIGKPT